MNISFAPFQGITGRVFREVFTKHFTGVDQLITPFFAGIHKESSFTERKISELGPPVVNGIEVIPQILSKEPAEILLFGEYCLKHGFSEINWNLGCPYPQVASKRRGSGLLPYPDQVESILEQVYSKAEFRFSVKCRLGYHSREEIARLIPIFNRFPLAGLTIHARIGRQLYKGHCDYEAFDACIAQSSHPLSYNGDLFTAEEILHFKSLFPGIESIMLGRGLLHNPLLAMQAKAIALPENVAASLRVYVDDLYFQQRRISRSPHGCLGNLKEFWSYFAYTFADPVRVLRLIRQTASFDAYEDAVNLAFAEAGPAQGKPPAVG